MSSTTSLNGTTLAGLLVEVEAGGRSGVVSATQGKLKRLFCVSKGRLVWALSNVVEEQLDQAFVDNGAVTDEILAVAAAAARGGGGSVASLLLQRGMLPRTAAEPIVSEHVRSLVLDTLFWRDGTFSFEPGIPDLRGEPTVELPCSMLILEMIRDDESGFASRARAELSRPGTHLSRSTSRDRSVFELRRDPIVDRLLDACRDGAPAAIIVSAAEVEADIGWRTLHALVACGVLEKRSSLARTVDGPVTRAEVLARLDRAEDADNYAVLELAATATSEDVRGAYYFLARRYHPDRFRSGALADLLAQIEAYFTKVTEAYNTLFDPDLRAEYDERRASSEPAKREQQDTTELALKNYVRARSARERGRFADAAQWLENAVKLAPGDARYRRELGHLLIQNPRRRPEAAEHLHEAARLDPADVDTYVALGELCEKLGKPDEAVEHYREALRWEPGHLVATDALKALGKG